MNKREIKVYYSKHEQAFTIQYLLHGETQTLQFNVRTISGHSTWEREHLPIGIEIHNSPQGFCYCDGSSLQAEAIWDRFKRTGDEEIIWEELENRMKLWT